MIGRVIVVLFFASVAVSALTVTKRGEAEADTDAEVDAEVDADDQLALSFSLGT